MRWPYQISVDNNCQSEQDVFFKYDGFWMAGSRIQVDVDVPIGHHCEFNIKKSIAFGEWSLTASGCKFIDHDYAIVGIGKIKGPGREAEITL